VLSFADGCPAVHFLQMNKLKKMALMVVGQNLNTDELQGVLCLCCHSVHA
jgi:hypothetical protein